MHPRLNTAETGDLRRGRKLLVERSRLAEETKASQISVLQGPNRRMTP